MSSFTGDSLIFLISQPRSGSTLLQRLINGHPLVESAAEPWLMLPIVFAQREEGFDTRYNHRWAALGNREFRDNYGHGADTRDEAIRAYAAVHYEAALADGYRYFLDKTPRYYYIVPELMRIFPDAHFIILLRNPLSVLASMLRTWTPHGYWPHLLPHADDLLVAPERLLDAIDRLGDRAHVVHYEALVQQPEVTLSALLAELSLTFEPAMLHYAERSTVVGSLGDPVGVHQHAMPTPGSLDNWREAARHAQRKHFMQQYLGLLGDSLVERLGYSAAELREQLDAVEIRYPMPLIDLPTMLKPLDHWSLRERLWVEYALTRQRGRGRKSLLWLWLRRLREGRLRLRLDDPTLEHRNRRS